MSAANDKGKKRLSDAHDGPNKKSKTNAPSYFADFSFADFWSPDEDDALRGAPLAEEMVAEAEKQLGYKLPAAYIEFLRSQNGGSLRVPMVIEKEDAFVDVMGIYGVDSEVSNGLIGTEFNSKLWIEEWNYPKIGVYFGESGAGEHVMVCLDYEASGPNGEPRVVSVDVEEDNHITELAPTFAEFIKALQPMPDDEEGDGQDEPDADADAANGAGDENNDEDDD
eukprot:c12996_g1_i1.p1 GENE.c12996_g1_i1~~c12996_g1_i1.p1  ORF type:complete len:237 (+),score=59.43 c12996_g1_i1:41-712(+)